MILFPKGNTAADVTGLEGVRLRSRVRAKEEKRGEIYDKENGKGLSAGEEEPAFFFLIAVDLYAHRLAPVGLHSLDFGIA